jgi:hypothetical protein
VEWVFKTEIAYPVAKEYGHKAMMLEPDNNNAI